MARPPSPSAVRAAVLVLIVALGLGACGRRGRLEPPPTPESIAAAEKAKESKSGIHKRAPNPPIRPPQQPFVLDPIL
ncbi:LPS translocon maturation chaperone LptM [Lichenibacterium dinghuense]|uniref:LPS translocon maturation chaperone LptM n=1 Tax=Lichenibacterium dinghuense TaxID=2895977 RepID=UPI001F324BF0|nr:lipoprotein [Lichenibacterium sp. 6Y81]